MAIQINQLIIRTTITDDASPPETSQTAKDPSAQANKKSSQATLVADCVEQVMELLRERQER
jgi:Family of unknown function (DUF5908)